MNCLNCSSETKNLKFCSRSCSASFNNKGVNRHNTVKRKCNVCNNLTYNSIYCSNKCSSFSRTNKDQVRVNRNIRQSKYRAKQLRKLSPLADPDKIRVFYKNWPPGHEVDHILPLSKGGLHHHDNLQYLTVKENRSKGNKILI